MPRNPKKKKKKARDRAENEDSAGAEDARQEIADKIQEQKVAKAKSKLSFTRRKNQVLDLLEDAIAANHREIRDSQKLLDEAQKRVIEDLSSLAELYLKASDRSALEKTSREIKDIEEEFAKAQECFREYLHAIKLELSSQASEFFRETIGLTFKGKEIAPTRFRPRKKFRQKEESINRARTQLDEEYARRQKGMETNSRS